MKTSSEVFKQLLIAKHKEIKARYNELLKAIIESDFDLKIDKCSSLQTTVRFLFDMITESDRPQWLTQLDTLISNYIPYYKNENHGFNFLNALIDLKSQLFSFNWDTFDSTQVYDFDKMFEKYRSENRIDELFERITETLQQIVDSNCIDSIKLIDVLNKLINSIKRNQNGSYFAIRGIWDFIVNLITNYLWEQLVQVPGLGPLLSALRTTITDMNTELTTVHESMKQDMSKNLQSDFPFLRYDSKADIIEDRLKISVDISG
jgi:hypothetical protein